MNNEEKVEYQPRTFWEKAREGGVFGYFIFLIITALFWFFLMIFTLIKLKEHALDITGLLLGAGVLAEFFCLGFTIFLFEKERERIDEMN